MEKMHVSSTSHAAQTATSVKNRAADIQGQGAVPGDFLGLLSALGDTLFQGTPEMDLLPTADSNNPPAVTALVTEGPSTANMSLLALQAGFSTSPVAFVSPPTNVSRADSHAAVGGLGFAPAAVVQSNQKTTTGIFQASGDQLRAQAPSFTTGSSETPDARISTGATTMPNFFAIRQSESGTEISGNSPSRMGIRKVGVSLNELAQADAVGHGRPVEGIPAIHGEGGCQIAPAVTTPATAGASTANMSLFALQAGFSTSPAASVSPPTNNALPASGDILAVGSRGMSLASGGGELGLVAQTAALDGAMEAQAEQGLGAVAKKIAAAARLASPAAEALTARTPIGLRQESLERPTAGAALTAALQTALMGSEAPRNLAAAAAGGQSQSAWGTPSPSMDVPAGLPGQEAWWSTHGQSAARGGEGGRNGSGQNPEGSGLAGAGGLTAESPTVGESPVFDGASALPAEDAVAEQVSYWVSQNIQNAELTVEHAGHPVEVTVTLSGNEAHVSFRSDQDETRALLDASVAQLRDLLESQGLSLSGMTVGDSATQGNANNPDAQRDTPQGARQSTTVQASIATDGQRSVGTVTDKAVDIFV